MLIKGKSPVVSNTSFNNGIIGYINKPTTEYGNVVTFSDTTTDEAIFYQPNDFVGYSHVQVLTPLENTDCWNDKTYSYFISTFRVAVRGKYDYGTKFNRKNASKEIVILPVHSNGTIAFDYMEAYIKELEAERIKELESYLVSTGLNAYILNDDEEKVFSDFINNNVTWGEFMIEELFEVQTSRKRFDANKVTIQKNGSPYVVRTSLNNGTRGLINEDQKYLNEANTISFGQDTATMFYQKKPYFTGDKIKVLIPKFKGFNEIIAQFLITSMTKSFSTFTWGSSSYNVKIINSQKIKVLTNSNGEPDYDKMILLIKSFEKLVIEGVVKWKDKQIEATRKIVSKNDIN